MLLFYLYIFCIFYWSNNVSNIKILFYSENAQTQIEIEEYITDDITKKILSHQLDAADIYGLECNGRLNKLMGFVIASFKSHYNGKDVSSIKKLDHLTKDISIPSKSRKNIANNLNVSYFYLMHISLFNR